MKGKHGKFAPEIKQRCVDAALAGEHLNVIQMKYGPNPKAIMRYLKKRGIDYMAFRDKLIAEGKKPKTLVQLSKEKEHDRKKKRKVSI